MLAALRERAAALGLSYQTLDELSGVTDRYSGKLIGPRPTRSLSGSMFDAIVGALSCRLILVHDESSFRLLSSRYVQRNAAKANPGKVTVFTTRFYKKLGRLGHAARMEKTSPERRSEIARQASLARRAKLSEEERHALARRMRAGRARQRVKA
jgi:hypothetical protein